MAESPASDDAFAFDSFKLLPRERALYDGERIVKIGGRAFDVLVALLESAGNVVTPQELIAKVWRDVAVDEANLRVHIATLRKLLRDGRDGRRLIATSVGNGYLFVDRVSRLRMMAWARHLHARYAEGLRLAERVLGVPPPPRVTYGTQRVDGRVMMHTLVAKTQWLVGRPETALREARRGVDIALERRHAGTLCYVLSLGACPVALWAGNTDDARRYIALLIETASMSSLGFWLTWGRAFDRQPSATAERRARSSRCRYRIRRLAVRPPGHDPIRTARRSDGCAPEVGRSRLGSPRSAAREGAERGRRR